VPQGAEPHVALLIQYIHVGGLSLFTYLNKKNSSSPPTGSMAVIV